MERIADGLCCVEGAQGYAQAACAAGSPHQQVCAGVLCLIWAMQAGCSSAGDLKDAGAASWRAGCLQGKMQYH